MINEVFAASFAKEWITAWNERDIRKILSHYSDNFTMHSPLITEFSPEDSGIMHGKEKVKKYWENALNKLPELNFKLLHVLSGVNSITIVYSGIFGVTAEVFEFNLDAKVSTSTAHYSINNLRNVSD